MPTHRALSRQTPKRQMLTSFALKSAYKQTTAITIIILIIELYRNPKPKALQTRDGRILNAAPDRGKGYGRILSQVLVAKTLAELRV